MTHDAGTEYELTYWSQGQSVVGIDEAGRGPIAGPLVVAGVVFRPGYVHPGIYDSKAISQKKREALFPEIVKEAQAWKIVIVTPEEIDELNIYRATQKAMHTIAMAVDSAGVLTDAMPLPLCRKPVLSIIKGDQKSISIAAASILAKVVRDHIMLGYDHLYPQYGFAAHKGYPTRAHLEAMERYGVLPFYRKSYGPVAKMNQMALDLGV